MTKSVFIEEGNLYDIIGFNDDNDIFEYRQFGERLSNLVSSISEKSTVFLLDGEWGSGKSYFIRQFAGLMREKGAPVILFDSFASDYIEDGFVALATAVHGESKKMLKPKSVSLKNYVAGAKGAASLLLPIGTRLALRAAGGAVLDIDAIKQSGLEVSEALKSLFNESEKAIEAAVEKKIEQVSEEKATIQRFQNVLADIAEDLSKTSKKDNNARYPLIFIVDELDRCRPEFALNLLEKIKHIFSIHNVCFILVANLTQLEASVSGIYGSDFDGKSYLEKFYQYKILLPANRNDSRTKTEVYLRYLFSKQQAEFSLHIGTQSVLKFIAKLSEIHNLQLRQIERIVTHLSLVHRATSEKYLIVSTIISGLCVMRIVRPSTYDQVRRGLIDWNSVEEFLTGRTGTLLPGNLEGFIGKREAHWWKFAANGTLTQDVVDRLTNEISKYETSERKDLLVTMCSYVDELAQN